jgi:hypothetical protein
MLPTISITSPTAGMMVAVTPPTDTVMVNFTTTNFMFAKPGSCPPNVKSTPNCGHIHVLIDGAACTPANSPYNNDDEVGSPASAILSSCPMANGSHTISLELHHDDHSPIVDASMMTIQASVMITATGG